MKLRREEFQRSTEESALELFTQGIRAKETKEKYTRTLRMILCNTFEEILDGDFGQRAAQLVKLAKEDPKWVRDLLLNLSRKLNERTKLQDSHPDKLKTTSIDNYFKPIKKLLDMNDVSIPWKRIYATFPEIDNLSDGRGWNKAEIQKMLVHANGAIDRSIILVASSSGIRSGAFDLNWGDITPIYKADNQLKTEITESEEAQIVCAAIKIYKGTQHQYPAFITLEAYSALMDYKQDWISEIGHEPKQDDPIFKNEGVLLRRATPNSIKKRVERMATRSGLRKPLPKGQNRYEIPLMNGFRRFWNKTCKEALSSDSPLASLIKKEYMMGHMGL